MFFNLRTMDYIEEFSGFTESVGGKSDSKGKVLPKYYSATSKGYQVFYKIIQQVTDYGLIYTINTLPPIFRKAQRLKRELNLNINTNPAITYTHCCAYVAV